jgi:hypothetical protein
MLLFYCFSRDWVNHTLNQKTFTILRKMSVVSDKTLKILHGSAALCHLIQGAYAEALVNTVYKDKAIFEIANPTYDNTNVIGSYDLAQLVPIFSLLSSANHTWALFDFQRYAAFVEKGYNPIRWTEYSMSAGLMTYIIASLSGITDIKTLVGILIANVALQYTGYSVEKLTAQSIHSDNSICKEILYQSAIREQIIGFLIFAVQMAIVWVAFFTSVAQSDQDVPIYVWTIIFILTALYLTFGLLSVCYTRGAKPSRDNDTRGASVPNNNKTGFLAFRETDFRKVEVGYIALSFISKTFLMNMVLFGSVSATPTISPTPSVV